MPQLREADHGAPAGGAGSSGSDLPGVRTGDGVWIGAVCGVRVPHQAGQEDPDGPHVTGLAFARRSALLLSVWLLLPVLWLMLAWLPVTAAGARSLPLRILPHGLFLLTAVLGGVFRQGRVVFITLLMSVTTLLADVAFHRYADAEWGQSIVLLATLYLPAITVILYHLREQGLWNMHGVLRLVSVASVVLVLMLLPLMQKHGVVQGTGTVWWRAFSPAVHLPLVGLIGLVAGLFLLALRNPHESPVLGPLLGVSLVYTFAGLNIRSTVWSLDRGPLVLAGFMSGAAVVLAIAVLESAWRVAHIDELTELPGRRALRYRLSQLGSGYMLAMVDIDHFKKVNDTYGHETGDQVLRFLASFLRSFSEGTAFRSGGEEFVLVCPHGPFSEVVDALDELRERIAARPFVIRGKDRPADLKEKSGKVRKKAASDSITVTVSIGVAMQDAHHATPDEVLDAADKALYLAKRQGRNRVRTAR